MITAVNRVVATPIDLRAVPRRASGEETPASRGRQRLSCDFIGSESGTGLGADLLEARERGGEVLGLEELESGETTTLG
jgi:hypothetical protein